MRAMEVAEGVKGTNGRKFGVLPRATIKRSTLRTILREARRTGRMVVVASIHSVIGGTGEAVATQLLRGASHDCTVKSAAREFRGAARCTTCKIAMASSTTSWRYLRAVDESTVLPTMPLADLGSACA